MEPTIPQPLADALNAALQARADVDAATAAKQTSDAALSAATADNDRAASDLASKTDILNAARTQLEALEDAFLRPGGTLPSASSPSSASTLTRS